MINRKANKRIIITKVVINANEGEEGNFIIEISPDRLTFKAFCDLRINGIKNNKVFLFEGDWENNLKIELKKIIYQEKANKRSNNNEKL